MRPKERALITFARQVPDRVPVNYMANPGIDGRLKEHYGMAADDDEGLRQALGVDFRTVTAPYVGPKLHADVPDRSIDMWGIHRRWIEHESGGYWDYCDFPLRQATLEEVEAWPMPAPDDFDYDDLVEQCTRYAATLFAGRAVASLRALGGAAALPGVVDYLAQNLGIDEIFCTSQRCKMNLFHSLKNSPSTNEFASKTSISSNCSPVPIYFTGICNSLLIARTTPPLAVPSSLVKKIEST